MSTRKTREREIGKWEVGIYGKEKDQQDIERGAGEREGVGVLDVK